MIDYEKCPKCDKKECASHEEGHCLILTKNNFNKECTFFKTKEQVEKEKEYCRKRMAEIKKGEI